MKKKTIYLMLILAFVLSACNFPNAKKTETPPPTPTPIPYMQLYQGLGMQIMLPPTYVSEDIKTELPRIIETITNLIGSSDGVVGDLIKDLEGNVAWYGYDSGTPAVFPTRLIVVKNKTLASTPISLLTFGLERILNKENVEADSDTITINNREMTRFTYSKDGNAWVAYIFKAEGRLWLNIFITTPANLAVSLNDFDTSIGSMTIDPIPQE